MGAALTEGLDKSILVFRRDNGLNKGQRLMAKGNGEYYLRDIARRRLLYLLCDHRFHSC